MIKKLETHQMYVVVTPIKGKLCILPDKFYSEPAAEECAQKLSEKDPDCTYFVVKGYLSSTFHRTS